MHANATDETIHRFDKLRHADGRLGTAEIRLKMQQTMQNHCAVFRKQDILEKGIQELSEAYAMLEDIQIKDRSLIWNTDLMEALELQNMMPQAMVTLQSALYRTESRGAHARDDFPERDDVNWLKHTLCWWDESQKTHALDSRPVHMNTLTKDVTPIPLQKRVY
jgi:succinate dehydrogenase / fumarate reductase flavoprotein subunit